MFKKEVIKIQKRDIITVIFLFTTIFAQSERWIYRYNSPYNSADWATAIVNDNDGNLYIGGVSYSPGSADYDFVVIGLTNTGSERWVYRYNHSGNDHLNSICYGTDGNIYCAGYTAGISSDFTILSLTPEGTLRWIYTYNGSANSYDEATSIVYGSDGNIYAAGRTYQDGSYGDFTVISLLNNGVERWIYRYNGPGDDGASAIIYAPDSNLYIAGMTTDILYDFTVISLSNDGSERWVYQYNGPDNGDDWAYGVVYGNNGNIYAAGYSRGVGTTYDITVVSLTDSGIENWIYRYSSPGYIYDVATSITLGLDNNIYISGRSGTSSNYDMIVISLSDSGMERWNYIYNGSGNANDEVNAIAWGLDCNIYIAGYSTGVGSCSDFSLISLTTSGVQRWVYQYNGPANSYDYAVSVIYAGDSYIYAAGGSCGIGTTDDFVVISLDPWTGIKENECVKNLRIEIPNLEIVPNPFRNATSIKFQIPEQGVASSQKSVVSIKIYDVTGRLVRQFNHLTNYSFNQVVWDGTEDSGRKLPAGIYFIRLESDGFKKTEKVILLR